MVSSTVMRAAAAAALALASSGAVAAGTHAGHGGADIGQPGQAERADRTVEVVMYENYYEPETITVAPGETVRFRVRNAGALVHEFSIATPAMHAAHQGEMRMLQEHGVLLPDRIDREAARAMEASMGHGMHHEANSVMLEPGQSAEVVWTFPAAAAAVIEFGCNVPGHYDSGMVGRIDLEGGS